MRSRNRSLLIEAFHYCSDKIGSLTGRHRYIHHNTNALQTCAPAMGYIVQVWLAQHRKNYLLRKLNISKIL